MLVKQRLFIEFLLLRVEQDEGATRGSVNGEKEPSMEVGNGMIVDESPSIRDSKINGKNTSERGIDENFGIKRARVEYGIRCAIIMTRDRM